jgi:hypothetical protein
VFPFTFNNKTFSHCTSEGNRNAGVLGGQHILWCGVLARATASFPDATDAFPTPSPGAAGEKQSGGLGGMGDGMLSPKWDEATDDWGNCLFNGAPSTTGGNALEGQPPFAFVLACLAVWLFPSPAFVCFVASPSFYDAWLFVPPAPPRRLSVQPAL